MTTVGSIVHLSACHDPSTAPAINAPHCNECGIMLADVMSEGEHHCPNCNARLLVTVRILREYETQTVQKGEWVAP